MNMMLFFVETIGCPTQCYTSLKRPAGNCTQNIKLQEHLLYKVFTIWEASGSTASFLLEPTATLFGIKNSCNNISVSQNDRRSPPWAQRDRILFNKHQTGIRMPHIPGNIC